MISTLLRFILACLFLPCMLAAAEAQGVSFPKLGDTVPGHQDVTYLDLARMVVPDLAAGENGGYKGSSPIEMRHILGPDGGGSPPASLSVPDPAVLDIKAGGKDRLVMLIDLGQAEDSAEGFTVLALYELAGKPRLLDAVNVAVDRSTDFRDPDKLSLGPGDDAIITTSSHFNSNQGYASTALVLVRNDRFELIDMIYTFDENYCAYRRTQDIAFKTLAGGKRYAAIKVTVTDATKPSDEGCDEAPPRAVSHAISVTYRWRKARSKFVANSDAFGRLAAENAKRF